MPLSDDVSFEFAIYAVCIYTACSEGVTGNTMCGSHCQYDVYDSLTALVSLINARDI